MKRRVSKRQFRAMILKVKKIVTSQKSKWNIKFH
jgi:hypothetical protein